MIDNLYTVIKEFFDFFVGDLNGVFVLNGGDFGFINVDLYHLFLVVFSIIVLFWCIIVPIKNIICSLFGKKKVK